MPVICSHTRTFLCLPLLFCIQLLTACASDSYAAKGAAQGAQTGAAAGAVGSMVTALVFGGDIIEAGARGAVYGASTGAVAGSIAGAEADKAAADRRQAEQQAQQEQLRQQIGPDAFNSVVALVDCKHSVAIANAKVAANDPNPDYALAGVWLEAISLADNNEMASAQQLYPQLVELDRDISSLEQAGKGVNTALGELRQIRQEYQLPATCH